jgi:hypothetical protein
MNNDMRVYIGQYTVNVIGVEYIKFDDFWRADAAQSSSHSIPSVESELLLYLSSQKTTRYTGQLVTQ